jgi:hypothetical protein
MLLLGLFFLLSGIIPWRYSGAYDFRNIILIGLGSILSFWGIHILIHRHFHSILIDQDGIRICKGNKILFLYKRRILEIRTYANLRGRGLLFSLIDGKTVYFDCRKYCSESTLLNHCKQCDLPCA